jgi:5-methylcytosine-specific restriction endonuclease McrA
MTGDEYVIRISNLMRKLIPDVAPCDYTFEQQEFAKEVEQKVWDNLRSQNPIPKEVRTAVFKRAKNRCEECGSVERLELHHLYYWYGCTYDWPAHDYRELIFGHETPEDLKALCRDCHNTCHVCDGRFFRDPEMVESVL